MEVLTPVAAAASLLLPGVAAPVGFGLCFGLWMWHRRSQGRSFWVTLAAVATLALLLSEVATDVLRRDPERITDRIATSYEQVWGTLDEAAERTAESLAGVESPRSEPLVVFQTLSEEASGGSQGLLTLLLLDGTGEVLAWGGKGLLHDIGGDAAMPAGRSHRASFSAVTLFTVRSLTMGDEALKLAAGLSLRVDQFPFAPPGRDPPRWTVVAAGAPVDPGSIRIPAGTGPELILEKLPIAELAGANPWTGRWRRAALMVWGLALLAGSWRLRSAPLEATPLAAVGMGLTGLALGAPWWAVTLLVGGTVLGCLASWPGIVGRYLGLAWSLGIVAALSLPTAVTVGERFGDLPNLGNSLGGDATRVTIRVALAFWMWASLALVRSTGKSSKAIGIPLLAVGVGALWVACSSLDRGWVPWLLLALAGGCTAAWKRGVSPKKALSSIAVLGILSISLSALGWELAYREVQERRVAGALLMATAPPTESEIEALGDAMKGFFDASDLGSLAPVGVEELAQQDLAFEVWHHSPLADYGRLSALRVLPRKGGLSSFSFGLPLNEEQWVDWASPLWSRESIPEWEDAAIVGDGELLLNGEPWAYAEYALLLEPGFRTRPKREEDLAEVLLRAGPRIGEPDLSEFEAVTYGLYDPEGKPIVSPWIQTPEIPTELLAGGEARVDTPDGPALAYSAVGSDGVRVLFLQRLSAAAGVERVATHAFPALCLLGLGLLAAGLPYLSQAGLRKAWYSLWHSYSKRLALVYSILLLLPLGIINLIIVRAIEDRLVREQEAAGLLAIESAQGVLGEYVLALEPGFGIDAVLDDQVLYWLSSIVHHDLNLYWRGSVYASSKAELFTAGLLPRRIPGEIYSGLTLRRYKVSMRTESTGRTEYLELYAPVTVPGVALEQTRLILSMPLLAQQQETASQIASLRRRSLLGTVAVVLLIVTIGVRLARRFTTPLTDIVSGTQRIAAGESSLQLRPVELELATLVAAIDDMAARIHAGRQQLLREKNVVERMVENITAGIVSLDHQQRVLMANRVAANLIGVAVGQELGTAVGEQAGLTPLAEFLSVAAGGELAQQTVSLPSATAGTQEWTVVWVPLPGEGEPSALLVLEDVTEVLRGQRLQAWAEMARMIAHEIKNPLTPIRLSAEHMREVHAGDPEGFEAVFEDCTDNILRQVEALQEIASEFSTYSRIPRIEPRLGDLVAAVREVVEAYKAATREGIEVRLDAATDSLAASFDPKLIGRAVRNLMENALRATPRGGRVVVEVAREGPVARISVLDTGPGVPEELLARIFDPYFSTHDAGTGLGLPIARRIAEEHGGKMVAHNRASGGLEVVLTLPIVEA